jgi:hypothetical protein
MKDRTILHWNLIFVTWYQSQLFWSRPFFFSSIYRLNSSVFGDFFLFLGCLERLFLLDSMAKTMPVGSFSFTCLLKGRNYRGISMDLHQYQPIHRSWVYGLPRMQKLSLGYWGLLNPVWSTIFDYFRRIYSQNNSAQKFQVEMGIANYKQGNLSIEQLYAGFLNL